MVYNDIYEIALEMDGQDIELAPSLYSFVMEDSIYRLYPRLSLSINDQTAIFQEYLATVEGLNVSLRYGLEDNSIKCPYVIKYDELPNNTISGFIGGNIDITLIHDYYSKQTAISKYFENSISKIISDKANNYNFGSVNVDSTVSKYGWYQPLVSDAEFMLHNLLPFAYSSDTNDTPYYLFIDSNNDFFFKSFKSMIETNPVTDLYFTPKTEKGSNTKSINAFGRYRIGSDITKNNRHRVICQIDDSDGSFNTENDYLTDYPSNTNQVPIIYDKNNITSYFWIDRKEDEKALQDNNNGFKINAMRNSMLLDKIIIALPLNIDLRAGKTVNIILPYSDNGEESSLLFSGKYLIDRSWHSWDSRSGNTLLSIGRKEANVPSIDYKMKDKLTKRE